MRVLIPNLPNAAQACVGVTGTHFWETRSWNLAAGVIGFDGHLKFNLFYHNRQAGRRMRSNGATPASKQATTKGHIELKIQLNFAEVGRQSAFKQVGRPAFYRDRSIAFARC